MKADDRLAVAFLKIGGAEGDIQNIAFPYGKGLVTVKKQTFAFDPASKLTRAQFVTLLYNISDKGADAYYKLPFTDVNRAAWYYNALAWCYENDIVSGTSPTISGVLLSPSSVRKELSFL